MTFLQPKQTMNSVLGVKIAQNPYFWFGYDSQKIKKDHALNLFFKAQKKVHENFSIQLKNDDQKLIFEAKTPERALKATFTSR